MKPVDRTWANVGADIMSVQRISKLGNIFATHFASLPRKRWRRAIGASRLRSGIPRCFEASLQGAEGTAKRDAIDATLVGFENRLGHIMNAYDVADAPAGFLTQVEEHFFKLTGVNAVIDNQRGDFEAMAARTCRIKARARLGQDRPQRAARAAGLRRRRERMARFKGVEWSKLGDGRTYLFPSDALKLSDGQVKAYLKRRPHARAHRAERR